MATQEVISHFLQAQGLNKKDIEVYLDLHKHGQSFASTVSTRTGIDRTTVYSVLKRLLKSGTVVQTKMNTFRAYVAVSPEIFMDKIDRSIEDLTIRKKSAQLFLEEMSKIKKQSFIKPKIRIYEGDESIMGLYEHTLERPGLQKSFLTIKRIPDSLKEYLKKQYIQKKLKKQVHSKVLIANTKFSAKYKSLDHRSNRETKIVTSHPFDLHSEVIMFNDNEVAMIDFNKQLYGIVIESATLYKTIETLFDFIWQAERAESSKRK